MSNAQEASSRPYAILVFSGGLDSTTLLYDALAHGYRVDAVSFDYGQRHKKELDCAHSIATKLGVRHEVIDLTSLGALLSASGSSLVDIAHAEVPEGHYAEESMKSTVVPNRNMIMLSIVGGIAVARGAQLVMTAVHAGDHFIYPDCRPEFIQYAGLALSVGNEGFADVYIKTPYINSSKAYIAEQALRLNVPLEQTWSCYKGGKKHCGRCGTCVERLEAIHTALGNLGGAGPNDEPFPDERVDQTEYEDREYWKSVTS